MPTAVRFSIVIPTRARLSQLRSCLRSIAELQYDRERFEVVVVNDGGPPLGANELAAFQTMFALKYIEQEWSGPAGARNRGVAEAAGEHIAFTDDDCTVASNWLTVLDEAANANATALIGGLAINALTDNGWAAASQMLVDYLYGYFQESNARRGPRFFASNNLCGRTDILRKLGPFDTSFRLAAGEDRDLADRWASLGLPLQYCRDAIVHHRHAMTFKSFTRQHVNYGRGAMTFHTARARRNGDAVRVEPLSFYSGLLTYPIARAGRRAPKLISMLAWSQLANAAGFFMERLRVQRGGRATAKATAQRG